MDGVGGQGEETDCRARVSGEMEALGGVLEVGDWDWEDGEAGAEFGRCCFFFFEVRIFCFV